MSSECAARVETCNCQSMQGAGHIRHVPIFDFSSLVEYMLDRFECQSVVGLFSPHQHPSIAYPILNQRPQPRLDLIASRKHSFQLNQNIGV